MYEYEAKVEKVVDGDTLDVVIDVGFGMFCKQRVRVNGIDTPEKNSTDLQEKKMGQEATEFVESWVRKQKKLRIKTYKDDKYGRLLADIYGDAGESLNEQMVKLGFAWKYDGGTKIKDLKVLIERRKK